MNPLENQKCKYCQVWPGQIYASTCPERKTDQSKNEPTEINNETSDLAETKPKLDREISSRLQ
jgi:hypothetical protein